MTMKTNGAKVLLYRLPDSDEKGRLIRGYLQAQEIPTVTATPMDSGRPLAAILGVGKGNMGKAAPLPKEPMLVMYGFDEAQLDGLLEFLRQSAPVPLKAVATPTNLRWSLSQLAAQLMAERAYHAKRNQ